MENIHNSGNSIGKMENILHRIRSIAKFLHASLPPVRYEFLYAACRKALGKECVMKSGIPLVSIHVSTIEIFRDRIMADPEMLSAIALHACIGDGAVTYEEVRRQWGEDMSNILESMCKAEAFRSGTNLADSDNYRGLLLSMAGDIRVIMVLTARNLAMMYHADGNADSNWVRSLSFDANYLYAQLAHRLGLYSIKSELEDLSLKYTDREIYRQIASKLNQTKTAREAYIKEFIGPVKRKLEEAGLKFEIKGRTKTISSIWHKIRTKKVDINHIYDLFAIRVILDSAPEREKADCWLAYSIVADMYTANPARMRDWISIPKSNGYESLHATVLGPSARWVEVQFRTRRMDLVAEKGLAAHWKYKGGKADPADKWMNNVRDVLETSDSGSLQRMKEIRLSDADKEVFAFTPKGDLLRLRPGSTVLDFAFAVHSKVGCTCSGAVVNGRHEKISYRIKSGDMVEIVTSATQSPRPDWLKIAISTKARNKIRQSLNEERVRKASLGKEILERRIRNRKLEVDESLLSRAILHYGYRHANDFYADLAGESIDISKFMALVQSLRQDDHDAEEERRITAGEFRLRQPESEADKDVLIVGAENISGLKYKTAKCCSPVNGDDIFGFISGDGVVKIHKQDCPNAPHLKARSPYRIIPARWGGASDTLLPVTLRVTGVDDIGIVTSVTSVVNKEKEAWLLGISIDSSDGLFQGFLRLNVASSDVLRRLVLKIKGVKGVKEVTRK